VTRTAEIIRTRIKGVEMAVRKVPAPRERWIGC
jgi:hypothetical protein